MSNRPKIKGYMPLKEPTDILVDFKEIEVPLYWGDGPDRKLIGTATTRQSADGLGFEIEADIPEDYHKKISEPLGNLSLDMMHHEATYIPPPTTLKD